MGFHPKKPVRLTGKPKNIGVHSAGYSLVDSSSGAKKMLKVEPYHALSSNEQVKSKFRYVFGRIDSYIPYKMG